MARAVICDRCGAVYVPNDDYFYVIDGRRRTIQGIIVVSNAEVEACFDLCGKCRQELNEFLHTKPGNPIRTMEICMPEGIGKREGETK